MVEKTIRLKPVDPAGRDSSIESIEKEEIRSYFTALKISSIAIDKSNCAYVTFHNVCDAKEAIKNQPHTIQGKLVAASRMAQQVYGTVQASVEKELVAVLLQDTDYLNQSASRCGVTVEVKEEQEIIFTGSFFQIKELRNLLEEHFDSTNPEKDASNESEVVSRRDHSEEDDDEEPTSTSSSENDDHKETGSSHDQILVEGQKNGHVHEKHMVGSDNWEVNAAVAITENAERLSSKTDVAATSSSKRPQRSLSNDNEESKSDDSGSDQWETESSSDNERDNQRDESEECRRVEKGGPAAHEKHREERPDVSTEEKEATVDEADADEIQVEYIIWKYIHFVPEYYKKLQDLEKRCLVTFLYNDQNVEAHSQEDKELIAIKVAPNIDDDDDIPDVELAKLGFGKLYEDICCSVIQEDVYILHDGKIEDAYIAEILGEYPRVFIHTLSGGKRFILIGNQSEVLLARFKFLAEVPAARSARQFRAQNVEDTGPIDQSSKLMSKMDLGANKKHKDTAVEEHVGRELMTKKISSKYSKPRRVNRQIDIEDADLKKGLTSRNPDIVDIDFSNHLLQFSTKGGLTVYVFQGNIVHQRTDAIVNAANGYLMHGSGVAGDIARAAGPELEKECRQIIARKKVIPVTKVVATTGGRLMAKYVIHAVGPVRSDFTDNEECLESIETTYYNCFRKADYLQLSTVSVPAISAGIYGVPLEIVAKGFQQAVMRISLSKSQGRKPYLKEVYVVMIGADSTKAFQELILSQLDIILPSKHGYYSDTNALDRWRKNTQESIAKENYGVAPSRSSHYDDQYQYRREVGPSEMPRRYGYRDERYPSQIHKSLHFENSDLRMNNQMSRYGATGGTYRTNAPSSPRSTTTPKTCEFCGDPTYQKTLKCGHQLCTDCNMRLEDSHCPICNDEIDCIPGNQPEGHMTYMVEDRFLPGFKGCGTIVITYDIPDGVQQDCHPYPGSLYWGTKRNAYLPDNKEGREVLRLLEECFEQRLIFTVGTSKSSGMEDCVTWSGIDHKTRVSGDFGYPDSSYLARVKRQIANKGITLEFIKKRTQLSQHQSSQNKLEIK